MSSTPRDVSGLLDVLLVLNDVLAHPAALHLFAFVSKRCGTVLGARSVMSVHGGAVGACCLNDEMLSVYLEWCLLHNGNTRQSNSPPGPLLTRVVHVAAAYFVRRVHAAAPTRTTCATRQAGTR